MTSALNWIIFLIMAMGAYAFTDFGGPTRIKHDKPLKRPTVESCMDITYPNTNWCVISFSSRPGGVRVFLDTCESESKLACLIAADAEDDINPNTLSFCRLNDDKTLEETRQQGVKHFERFPIKILRRSKDPLKQQAILGARALRRLVLDENL